MLASRCLSHIHSFPIGLLWETGNDLSFVVRAAGNLTLMFTTCGCPLRGPGRTLHMRPELIGWTTVQAAIPTCPCVWWLEDYNKFLPICVLKFSWLWVQREKSVSCLLPSNMLGCPGAFMESRSVLHQDEVTAGWSVCLLPTVTPGELVVGIRDAQGSSDS